MRITQYTQHSPICINTQSKCDQRKSEWRYLLLLRAPCGLYCVADVLRTWHVLFCTLCVCMVFIRALLSFNFLSFSSLLFRLSKTPNAATIRQRTQLSELYGRPGRAFSTAAVVGVRCCCCLLLVALLRCSFNQSHSFLFSFHRQSSISPPAVSLVCDFLGRQAITGQIQSQPIHTNRCEKGPHAGRVKSC